MLKQFEKNGGYGIYLFHPDKLDEAKSGGGGDLPRLAGFQWFIQASGIRFIAVWLCSTVTEPGKVNMLPH